jgi:hypothetical protein
MKRLTLWLIRRFANNREFRIKVSKELHDNAQRYFGEQSGWGRYYEAIGEFLEANPHFTRKCDTVNGIEATLFDVQKRLK